MPYRLNQFQSTVVKPYYKDNSFKPLRNILEDILDNILKDILENILKDILKNILKKNYNQHTLKGDYDFNIIVVDILQL